MSHRSEDIHFPTYRWKFLPASTLSRQVLLMNTAENRDGVQRGLLARIPQDGSRMTIGSEVKLARERADLSTEQADVLSSFAAENDLIVPPVARHATHDALARDMPFMFLPPQPVPLAPMRAARRGGRRALTLLALLGTAGWGAYLYQSSRPFDLDKFAVWASRWVSPADRATTAAATGPGEARPNDPTEIDPLHASNESAKSPDADRTADTGSNASTANVSEIARPAAAAPQTTGTSGSLAGPIKNVQNVSGEWRLDALTETSDSSFQRLKLHYEVKLSQDGDRVAGVGTKVDENEKEIGPGANTPVTMTGTIAGDRLTLNVVELRTQREARGKIVLLVGTATGELRGRFSSSAAPSSGHIEARRVSSVE